MPILSAQRSRNGQIAVAFTTGLCQLLDSQGKELKQFKAGPLIGLLGANIELLPNGHVLLPIYSQQLVAEFDWSGKRVWQANVPRPLSVSRLANGNTLVTTSITPYRIIEIDRSGQEVWSYNVEGRAVRARRW
jgi:hypothetical protein